MKRPYILVIVGVVLIIAAIALNYMLTKSADEETAPVATQTPAATTETTPTEPAPEPESAAPEITNPTFDVVRIGPDGNAVIAGRAEPNSTVRITDGEEVIGEATADERGEWVVLPNKPLASGDRELSLESEDATGKIAKADDKVVVLIPEEQATTSVGDDGATPDAASENTTASASDPAAEPDQAPKTEKQPVIALKVPSEGNGAATVMQGPTPQADPETAPGSVSESVSESGRDAATQTAEARAQDAAEPKAQLPRLSIDIVDYDTEGRVAMSGKADMGHTVRIYLDNKPVGSAPADENGNWSLTIGEPIEPGNYTMRADQIDESGTVTARVEIPFERARPDQILEPGSRYVVQPGNSLWRIARRTYGEGLKYWVIYHQNRNQIRDPDLIYPGQIFALPNEETPQ